MRRKHRYQTLRLLTAGACAYESFAILADIEQVPTFSLLCYRHKWAMPILVLALIVHLAWPGER